jgi:hypothetical protein
MPSDADILQIIKQAFAECRRPEHFTDYTHCEECAEHDEVLRSRDVDTLRIEDVGNPGWDPICFTTWEGFAYYFPALARLAFAEPEYADGWYGTVLLFHLVGDGRRNRRLMARAPEWLARLSSGEPLSSFYSIWWRQEQQPQTSIAARMTYFRHLRFGRMRDQSPNTQ